MTQNHLNVLIVEDDAYMASAIKDVLENNGVRDIRIRDTAMDAISEARGRMPDLIFSDYHLRQGTGVMALKAIMETKAKKPFVVGMSSEFERKDDFLKAGAHYFYEKPIRARNIVEVLLREETFRAKPRRLNIER